MADIVSLGLALDSSKVLQARDRANRALSDIANRTKKTNTQLAKMSSTFSRMATAVVGIATLRAGLRRLTAATIAGEQSSAKLEGVLVATGMSAGRTARQIDQLGLALARNTLFNDDEIRDTAAVLLTFRNISGQVFDDTLKAITDMSQVLGTDLKSTALQLGKALNDPVARLGELSRAGVTFSETQKSMVRSMVNVGDMAGAQNVILRELQMEFGGGAQAANVGLAGSLASVTKAYDNFLESLGRTQQAGGASDLLNFFAEFLNKRVLTTDPLEDLVIALDEVETTIERILELNKGGVSPLRLLDGMRLEKIPELRARAQVLKDEIDLINERREAEANAGAEAARRAAAAAAEDRARRENAQRLADEFNAQSRKQAEAFDKLWGRAIENVQDSFSGFFKELLTDGVSSFETFANRILDIWFGLVAQIAATKFLEAIGMTAINAAKGTPTVKTADDFLPGVSANAAFPQAAQGVTVVQNISFNPGFVDGGSGQRWLQESKGTIAQIVAEAAQDSTGFRHAIQAGT